MGFLRVYLALCVVSAHAGPFFPWQVHDGTQAVQLFYMISGFYMTLILSRSYSSTLAFYKSRAARVYFPYAVIFALIVALSLSSGVLRDDYFSLNGWRAAVGGEVEPLGFVLAAIFNFTVVGSDILCFLKQVPGQGLEFTKSFLESPFLLQNLIAIPQAWTVSLELAFYAFAPFLCRLRSSRLIGLFGGLVAVRIWFYLGIGLDHDPWTYRFMPFELALFIAGIFSCRLYLRYSHAPFIRSLSKKFSTGKVGVGGYLVLILLLAVALCVQTKAVGLLGQFIGQNQSRLIGYVLWIPAMALMFCLFRESKFDRSLGELSYPVYLIHLFVLQVIVSFMPDLDEWLVGLVCALVSLAVSLALYLTIFRRFDSWRHRVWAK